MQRNPSHFGSKTRSAPSGRASNELTAFDSIGLTGGLSGSFIAAHDYEHDHWDSPASAPLP